MSGTAGKFSFVPLLIAFGSGEHNSSLSDLLTPCIGLGLLGLATVVADLLVTKVLERKAFYSSHKFEIVEDDDYYSSNGNSVMPCTTLPGVLLTINLKEKQPLLSKA